MNGPRTSWAGVAQRQPAMSRLLALCTLLALLVALPAGATARTVPGDPRDGGEPSQAPVEQAVVEEIGAASVADFWIMLADRPDLSAAFEIEDWAERGQYVYDRLTATARSSQAELTAQLEAQGVDHEAFWIANAVLVRGGDQGTLDALRGRPEVAEIRADEPIELPEPIEPDVVPAQVASVEWGIASIRADEAWDAFGLRGEGIVVGVIDTGVHYDHPALVEQYRGNNGDGTFDHDYSWWDPAQVCGSPSLVPCDNHNHGTHVAGTIVGDDGEDNRIGVAPGAQWIAAKGCETGGCSQGALLSSGQFMLAPTDVHGDDPRPELRPHIVNNSWGGGPGQPWYDATVEAWVAAGIFPSFSAGNSGPGCDTVGSPADGPEAYAIGAYDVNNEIADFSSRGPGRDGEIQPHIAAPGVAVRSSISGGGYAAFSGTSMASPHLSGAVALMWSTAPALMRNIEHTISLLGDTAVPVEDLTCGGEPDDNNVWGRGRLDAHAAVEASPRGPSGALAGTVTDASTGEPLAGATVSFDLDQFTRSTRTGEDGSYAFPAVPTGEHDVTARAFGYHTEVHAVDVIEDGTVTLDFALEPAPSHPVSGTVIDDAGAPVLAGATVTILDTPLPPATTDAEGDFAFDSVPEDTYTLRVVPDGCLAPASVELAVDGPDTHVDVQLERQADHHGNTCRPHEPDWVETTDPLPDFPPNPESPFLPPGPVQLDLPFPFPFYDTVYGEVYVAHSGFVSFVNPIVDGASPVPDRPVPGFGEPDAAVYPFGTNINWHGGQPDVFTTVVGEEGERRFVVEWRDVGLCLNAACFEVADGGLDFQVVLHESGEITVQYRDIDPGSDLQRGAEAVVGIENAHGNDGLQFSFREPRLSDDLALRFRPAPFSLVSGTVHADAEGQPPAGGVTVRAAGAGGATRTTFTTGQGLYGLVLDPGTWDVVFTHPRYEDQTHEITVEDGDRRTLDVVLGTAAASLDPARVEASLTAGEQATVEVELTNTGSTELAWRGLQVPGTWSHALEEQPQPGEVLASWPIEPDYFQAYNRRGNSQIVSGDGTLWVATDYPGRLAEYRPDGVETGRSFEAWHHRDDGFYLLPTVQPAYDRNRGWLCTHAWDLEIGPAQRFVACVDPDVGEVIEHWALEEPAAATAMAYNPDEDIFYVGESGTPNRHQVAGLSHAEPGAILASCTLDAPDESYPQPTYDRTTNTLWFTMRGETHLLQVDPDDCSVLDSLPTEIELPDGPEEWGAWHLRGVAIDDAGDLFVAASGFPGGTGETRVYHVAGTAPAAADVPWLELSPASGALPPGETQTLEIGIDASGLASRPGIHDAELVLASNAGLHQGRTRLPVEVEVLPDGGVPPVVAASLDGELVWEDHEHGINFAAGPGREVTVTLSAQPSYQGADVDHVEYRLDGGDWTVYDEPFAVAEPAEHTVQFRATDVAGTTTAPESVTFTLAAARAVAGLDTLEVSVPLGGTVRDTVPVVSTGSRAAKLGLRTTGAEGPAPAPATPQAVPDTSDAVWVELPDLPAPRHTPTAAAVDGTLYAFGGREGGTAFDSRADVFALDLDRPEEGWEQLGDMPGRRHRATAGVIDGKVYMVGGIVDARPFGGGELWIYDPASDAWSTGAEMPGPNHHAASAVLDGQFYVVGGVRFDDQDDTDLFRYDPDADQWERLADLPESLHSQACDAIDGRIYCAGGWGAGDTSDRAYVYDPADDTWERAADLPVARWAVGGVAGNGNLLLAGGATEPHQRSVTAESYAYDPATDGWSQLPTANHHSQRAGVACGMYRVGGRGLLGRDSPTTTVEWLPGFQDCGEESPDPAPWLQLRQASASLEPGETADLDVELSAAGITEPGTYTAELALIDEGPYPTETVTVTMVVVEADEPGPPDLPGPPPWAPGPPPRAPGPPDDAGPPGGEGPLGRGPR